MNYPIPADPQEVVALRQKSVTSELIATAIAGVVNIARSKGQTLDDLISEVLKEDALLDGQQRHWLSEIVVDVWQQLPPSNA